MKKVALSVLLCASMGAHAQLGNLLEDLKKAAEAMQSTEGKPNSTKGTPGATSSPKQADSPVVQKPPAANSAPADSSPAPAQAEALPKQIAAAPKFNLKGFNIGMKPSEALFLVPALQIQSQSVIAGKSAVMYTCGQMYLKNKSTCSFTFGGIEQKGVEAMFWGDQLVMAKFVHSAGTDGATELEHMRIARTIRPPLEERYGKSANSSGEWTTSSELMVLEMHRNDQLRMWFGQLALVNKPLYAQYDEAFQMAVHEHQLKQRQEKLKKLSSDM